MSFFCGKTQKSLRFIAICKSYGSLAATLFQRSVHKWSRCSSGLKYQSVSSFSASRTYGGTVITAIIGAGTSLEVAKVEQVEQLEQLEQVEQVSRDWKRSQRVAHRTHTGVL